MGSVSRYTWGLSPGGRPACVLRASLVLPSSSCFVLWCRPVSTAAPTLRLTDPTEHSRPSHRPVRVPFPGPRVPLPAALFPPVPLDNRSRGLCQPTHERESAAGPAAATHRGRGGSGSCAVTGRRGGAEHQQDPIHMKQPRYSTFMGFRDGQRFEAENAGTLSGGV